MMLHPTQELEPPANPERFRMIKEQEAGLPTSELCRKHGLSPATFYKLKAKYGGMDLSDANRLKQLEAENAKLKRLVADVMLDRAIVAPLVQAQWRGSC
ncbi:transposase IS3 [Rhodobacter capsulatus B6]|nr:transposase IS3 [Rhodobacter capsulatus B6]